MRRLKGELDCPEKGESIPSVEVSATKRVVGCKTAVEWITFKHTLI